MPARFAAARFRSRIDVPTGNAWRTPVFFAALYVTGALCGAISLLWFPASLAHAVSSGFYEAAQSLQNSVAATLAAKTELAVECVLLLLVWIGAQLPLLPLGGPLLIGVCFLRSAAEGLCLSELLLRFGWRGAGFDLLAMVPWNILTGGGFVLACSVGYLHARRLHGTSRSRLGLRWWIAFHSAFLCALALCVGAMWVEGTLSPPVARLFAI